MRNLLSVLCLCTQLGFLSTAPPSGSTVQNRAANTYNLHYQLYTMKRSKEVGLDFKIPRDIITAGQLGDTTFYNNDRMYDIQVKYRSGSTAMVNDDQLLSTKTDDFSIRHQFQLYLKMIQNDPIASRRKRYRIVATNIDLDDSTRQSHFAPANVPNDLESLLKKDVTRSPSVYQLKVDSSIVQQLLMPDLSTPEIEILAETLYDHMVRNPRILNLDSPIIRKYHYALCSNNILKVTPVLRNNKQAYELSFDKSLEDTKSEPNSIFKTHFTELMNNLHFGKWYGSWRTDKCEVTKSFGALPSFPAYETIILSDQEIDFFVDKIVREQDEDIIIFNEDECRIVPFQKLAGYVLVSTPEAQTYAFSELFYDFDNEDHTSSLLESLQRVRNKLSKKLGALRKLRGFKMAILDNNFRTWDDGIRQVTTKLPSDIIYSEDVVNAFVDNFLLVVREPDFEDMAKIFDTSLKDSEHHRLYMMTHHDVSEWMDAEDFQFLTANNIDKLSQNFLKYATSFPAVPDIVKREELCNQLDKFVMSDGENIVAVTGEVGIGKSSAVLDFIQEYRTNHHSTVVWIEAQTVESIERSVEIIFQMTPSFWYSNPTSAKQTIHDLYHHFQYVSPVIFVFDNVEDAATIQPYLPNSNLLRSLKIIVTTSTKKPVMHLNPKEIIVQGFTVDEISSFIGKKAHVDVQAKLNKIRNWSGALVISTNPSILNYCIKFLNILAQDINQVSTLEDKVSLFVSASHDLTTTHPFMRYYKILTQHFAAESTSMLHDISFLHYDRIPVHVYEWAKETVDRLKTLDFVYEVDASHVRSSKYLQEFVLNTHFASQHHLDKKIIIDLLRRQSTLFYRARDRPNSRIMTHPMSVWEILILKTNYEWQAVNTYKWQIEVIMDGLMTDKENPYVVGKFFKSILLKFYERHESLRYVGKYHFSIFDIALSHDYWLHHKADHVSLESSYGEVVRSDPKYRTQDIARAIEDLTSYINKQTDLNEIAIMKIFQSELMLREPEPKYALISEQCRRIQADTSGSLETMTLLKLRQLRINILMMQGHFFSAMTLAKSYEMQELYLHIYSLDLVNNLLAHLKRPVHFDRILKYVRRGVDSSSARITNKRPGGDETAEGKKRKPNEEGESSTSMNEQDQHLPSTSKAMVESFCNSHGGGNSGGRRKRNTECLITEEDVDEIAGKAIQNDLFHVDGNKAMGKYFHGNVNDKEKAGQLRDFLVFHKDQIKIVGNSLYLNRMLQDKNHALTKHKIGSQSMSPQTSMTTSLEYANHAMMAYAVLAATETCIRNVTSLQCALGVGALMPFPLSKGLQKVAPWLIDSAAIVARAFAPRFTLAVVHTGISVAKFATRALAVAGAAFDIIDVGFQVGQLIKCAKGADCTHGEVQDSLVYIVMDGVSLIATAVAFAFPVAGLVVGLFVGVARIFYGAHRSVEQVHSRYHTTLGEDWSTFWRSLVFMEPRKEVLELMERTDMENMFADIAWSRLKSLKSDVIGYGILFPSKHVATMHLNRTLDRVQLSRVRVDAPKLLGNQAHMFCEPLFSGESFEYEKDLKIANNMFNCKDAMVVSNQTRAKTQNSGTSQSIIIDTRYFTNASVVGSSVYDNTFSVVPRDLNMTAGYEGRLNLAIAGGKTVTNTFVIQTTEYITACAFKGGENSTNIVEFLVLDDIHMVDIAYGQGSFTLSVDNSEQDYALIRDDYDPSEDNRTYKVIGNYGTPMKITCTSPESDATSGNVIISSNGGNATMYDEIINCDHVILSPYSRFLARAHSVHGKTIPYYLYVTRSITDQRDSSIDIDVGQHDQVVIKFLVFNVISRSNKFTFDNTTSTLRIAFPISGDDILTVVVLNYSPNRVALLDKYNNEIQAAVTSNTEDGSVAFHVSKKLDISEVRLDQLTLKGFLGNDIDFEASKVSATFHVVQRDSEPVATYRWGSRDKDVLVVPSVTKLLYILQGDNGCDIYILEPSQLPRDVKIVNYATDNCNDILVIKSTQKVDLSVSMSKRDSSAYIRVDETTVEIADYFGKGPQHRHLLVMNYASGEVFLPREDDMVLFIDPTPLSSRIRIDACAYRNGIFINASKGDVKPYRLENNNDLTLLSDAFLNPFVVTLENFSRCPIGTTFRGSPDPSVHFFNLLDQPLIGDDRQVVLEFNFETSETLQWTENSHNRLLLRTTANQSLISVVTSERKNMVVFYYLGNYLAMKWNEIRISTWEFVDSSGPSVFVSNFSRFNVSEEREMWYVLQLAAKTREIQSSLSLTEWTAITCQQVNSLSTVSPELFECLDFRSYSEVHEFKTAICPEYEDVDTSKFVDVYKRRTSNYCKLKNMETTCKMFIIRK